MIKGRDTRPVKIPTQKVSKKLIVSKNVLLTSLSSKLVFKGVHFGIIHNNFSPFSFLENKIDGNF